MSQVLQRNTAFVCGVGAVALLGVACSWAARPWEVFAFYVFALLALAGGLGVLLAARLIHAAVWLLASLGALGGLYLLLAAPFVAAIQLLVYVGGTLVLLLFGIALTERPAQPPPRPRPVETLAGFAVGAALFAGLAAIFAERFAASRGSAGPLPDYPVAALGRELLTTWLLPFELLSVLLLAAMIGAAHLARGARR